MTDVNLRSIVQVRKVNLEWCVVPKVASSSISNFLLPYLPNEPHHATWPNAQHEVLRRGGISKRSLYLPSENGFLVARHPLDRLVSAYKDKLENRTKNKYNNFLYKTVSKEIIK